jgi:transcription antitermination factor NusG
LSEFSYYTRYADKELTEKEITEEAEHTNNLTKKTELQKVPAIIPDDQMQAFIWLTSEDHEISYLGEPKDIELGDRVRVTEGPFKDFVGNIKRIKKDRKFIITIGTIATFTIGGITHKMVEKIE